MRRAVTILGLCVYVEGDSQSPAIQGGSKEITIVSHEAILVKAWSLLGVVAPSLLPSKLESGDHDL